MNAVAPLLVPLSAMNPFEIVRKHGYALVQKKSIANKGPAQSSRRFMDNAG
jgi:hypothetical protein